MKWGNRWFYGDFCWNRYHQFRLSSLNSLPTVEIPGRARLKCWFEEDTGMPPHGCEHLVVVGNPYVTIRSAFLRYLGM